MLSTSVWEESIECMVFCDYYLDGMSLHIGALSLITVNRGLLLEGDNQTKIFP